MKLRKDITYQGWSNAQTWAVALVIDNDPGLITEAVRLAKDHDRLPNATPTLIKAIAKRIPKLIYDMAPWAWDDGQNLDWVVWDELAEHYWTKYKERLR